MEVRWKEDPGSNLLEEQGVRETLGRGSLDYEDEEGLVGSGNQ